MSDVTLDIAGRESVPERSLTHKTTLGRVSGWYGVWWLIITEASLFAYLLFGYYYSLLQADQRWPVGRLPALLMPVTITLLLVASSIVLFIGQRRATLYEKSPVLMAVGIAFILGTIAVVLQAYDVSQRAPSISKSTYDSFYVLLAALDFLHGFVGVIALASLFSWVRSDLLGGIRRTYIPIIAVYWHFTVAVWLAIFATLTVLPYVS